MVRIEAWPNDFCSSVYPREYFYPFAWFEEFSEGLAERSSATTRCRRKLHSLLLRWYIELSLCRAQLDILIRGRTIHLEPERRRRVRIASFEKLVDSLVRNDVWFGHSRRRQNNRLFRAERARPARLEIAYHPTPVKDELVESEHTRKDRTVARQFLFL